MPSYAYKARNKSGQILSGKIDGDNARAAAAKLREKDLFPVSISDYVDTGDVMASVQKSKKIPLKVMTLFCRQFAVMVSAGLALMPAISILQRQTDHKQFKEVLADVRKSIESGESLSRALSRHPKAFPALMVNMVEAGETGGVLDKVLERVAEHFEKEATLTKKVKSAMTMPIITLVIAVLVTAGMVMFVLPMFAEMFDGSGVELPGITLFLLNMSDFLQKYILYLAAGIAAFVTGLTMYIRTPAGRRNKDALILKAPIFGPLTLKMVTSRFTRTFSTLLASGVPMLQSLEIVGRVADNVIVEERLKGVSEQVRTGLPLGQSLDKSGLFPPMVVHMTIIGEETGAVETLLTKVAQFFDEEVDVAVAGLTTAIQPIITIFLAGVVTMILLSVFLPMAKMMQVLG